jgi:hypothetical protein
MEWEKKLKVYGEIKGENVGLISPPMGPWLASGSGTPSPLEGWWAPVAQHYKREWGPRAQTTRFAAATVATHSKTLTNREGGAEATGCPTDAATGLHHRRPLCTARRCLSASSINRTRGAYTGTRYDSQRSPTRSTPRPSGETITVEDIIFSCDNTRWGIGFLGLNPPMLCG